MTGEEIYNDLISKRDYSGSKADQYAQFLVTLFFHIKEEELFPLLEKASTENKTLSLKQEVSDSNVLIDQYTIEDIVLI